MTIKEGIQETLGGGTIIIFKLGECKLDII